MSNSKLVNYKKISPNRTSPRRNKIKKITIHYMAGDLTVETCGNVFAPKSRQASANYGIDSKGRVGMYVEEKDRAWTSSSPENDNQAVTIEVANKKDGSPSAAAYKKLIELCVDICKRNGIKKLNYTGNKNGNLTMHCWFAATSCPGAWFKKNFGKIAKEVNAKLGATSTASKTTTKKTTAKKTGKVVVSSGVNVRKGAGTGYTKVKALAKGTKVTCYATKKVGKNTWWAINSGKTQWVCAVYNGKTYVK